MQVFFRLQDYLGKGSFRIEKNVKFYNFGPDPTWNCETSKFYFQGVPLPTSKKFFLADLDKLEIGKKLKRKVLDPPPVVKFHNFFFVWTLPLVD